MISALSHASDTPFITHRKKHTIASIIWQQKWYFAIRLIRHQIIWRSWNLFIHVVLCVKYHAHVNSFQWNMLIWMKMITIIYVVMCKYNIIILSLSIINCIIISLLIRLSLHINKNVMQIPKMIFYSSSESLPNDLKELKYVHSRLLKRVNVCSFKLFSAWSTKPCESFQ